MIKRLPIITIILLITLIFYHILNADEMGMMPIIPPLIEPLSTDTIKPAPAREGVNPLQGLNTEISLDLRNMDVIDVLKLLAVKGDINLVMSKGISGRVSLYVKKIKIKDALEIIVTTNDLAYEIKGDIVKILTEDEYEKLHGKKFADTKKIEIVELKNASTKDVEVILQKMKSPTGNILTDETTGTIIIVDVPEKALEIKEALESIERLFKEKKGGLDTTVFSLKYAVAEDISKELSAALTKDAGSMHIDKRTNTIVVTDYSNNMDKLNKMITAFDKKSLQVLIEAKIVQVILSDNYQMGVDWEALLSNSQNLKFIGAFAASPVLSSYQNISVGSIENSDYQVAIDLLKSIGKTNILSSPRITAINNQEAKILVGTREAYVTQTISQSNVSTTTAESIEFVEIGVKLYVTPTINTDGFITMKIKPEVSSVTGTLTTPQKSTIPIISTSEAETNVMVKDGVTIIMAGLIKDEIINEEKKVPFLGSIPLIGSFFKSTRETTNKSEIVVFITPHIISGEKNIDVQTFDKKERKPPITTESRERKPIKDDGTE